MLHLSQRSLGGPYASDIAEFGGLPTITPDIPICAVFIAFYICFAATNMTIFQINSRRRHKFVLSGMLFGFCMARIATLVVRIVWANRQHNVRLAIAANIFVNAGILLVYIINLVLAQRILRAMQPQIGWNPVLRAIYKVFYTSIGVALVMVITAVVVSLYTLDTHTRSTCRGVELAALTYLLIITCLPVLHIAASLLLPTPRDAENFGEGSIRSKIIIVSLSACLCMLMAGFKAGVNWSPPRPAIDPAWYDSKPCFYIFNFMCEILILCLLTFSRIDKRFFVPNGCNQAGDYTRLKGVGRGEGWTAGMVGDKH